MKLSPNSYETIRRLQDLPISVSCSRAQVFGPRLPSGRLLADGGLGPSIGTGSPKADLAGVWDLMFQQTYQTGDLLFIATREALQNSVDAIKEAISAGQIGKTQGEFRVDFDYNERSITWTDNGIGMSLDTVDNVFLSISSSQKTRGSAGGFGAAKAVILGISEKFTWRLETRDLIAVSEGFGQGEIKYYKASEFRQGVKLTIYNVSKSYLNYHYDMAASLRRMLRSNDFSGFYAGANRSNISLYFNGKKLSPLFKRNRGKKIELQDESGPVNWGDGIDAAVKAYRRRDSGGAYFVRLDGLIQFIAPARNTDLKVDVTVDLHVDPDITPKDSEYPLPVSRDALKNTAGLAFDVLREEIETDTRSAEDEEDYESYLPEDRSGEADRLAQDLEEAIDPSILKKISEVNETIIRTAPVVSADQITSDDVPDFGDTLKSLIEFIQRGEVLENAQNTDILALDPADADADPRVLVDALNRHKNARGEEAESFTDYYIRYVEKSDGYEGLKWAYDSFMRAFKQAQDQARAAEREARPTVVGEALELLDRTSKGQEISVQDAEVLDRAIEHVADIEMGPGGNGLIGAVGAIGATEAVRDLLPEADKERHRKKNPFGRLAALKINNKNYSKRRASTFKKNYSKYIPWLLLIDQAIRLTCKAGGYRGGKIFPGFILDDGKVALAEKPDRIGTDRYLYINPDHLGDLIEPPPQAVPGKKRKVRPKPDAFLIAAFLNGTCCHEITHLRGQWRHDEAFVVAREALGFKSAKTIPILAEVAVEILGLDTPVNAEVISLRKNEKKLRDKVNKLKEKLAAQGKACNHKHKESTPKPAPEIVEDQQDRAKAAKIIMEIVLRSPGNFDLIPNPNNFGYPVAGPSADTGDFGGNVWELNGLFRVTQAIEEYFGQYYADALLRRISRNQS